MSHVPRGTLPRILRAVPVRRPRQPLRVTGPRPPCSRRLLRAFQTRLGPRRERRLRRVAAVALPRAEAVVPVRVARRGGGGHPAWALDAVLDDGIPLQPWVALPIAVVCIRPRKPSRRGKGRRAAPDRLSLERLEVACTPTPATLKHHPLLLVHARYSTSNPPPFLPPSLLFSSLPLFLPRFPPLSPVVQIQSMRPHAPPSSHTALAGSLVSHAARNSLHATHSTDWPSPSSSGSKYLSGSSEAK
eukprot:1406893-Rhodomonas_salina.4